MTLNNLHVCNVISSCLDTTKYHAIFLYEVNGSGIGASAIPLLSIDEITIKRRTVVTINSITLHIVPNSNPFRYRPYFRDRILFKLHHHNQH